MITKLSRSLCVSPNSASLSLPLSLSLSLSRARARALSLSLSLSLSLLHNTHARTHTRIHTARMTWPGVIPPASGAVAVRSLKAVSTSTKCFRDLACFSVCLWGCLCANSSGQSTVRSGVFVCISWERIRVVCSKKVTVKLLAQIEYFRNGKWTHWQGTKSYTGREHWYRLVFICFFVDLECQERATVWLFLSHGSPMPRGKGWHRLLSRPSLPSPTFATRFLQTPLP